MSQEFEVNLPPVDRHGGALVMTRSASWENANSELLAELIELSNGCVGLKIAIQDTGWDQAHPAFEGMKATYKKDYTNSRTGWNDFAKHGSFVAHQIFRRCPKAEFGIFKVLGDTGGGSSDGIVRSTYDAADWGADFVNASLGASQRFNPMRDALDKLKGQDAVYCAASGNSSRDGIGWPANWGLGFNVCPLGSFNQSGRRSSFTSTGPQIIGLGAGERITAASAQTRGETVMSGTSMGCPNALALIACYHSARLARGFTKSSTVESFTDLIESIAQDIEADGRDSKTGYGNITLELTVKAMRKLETANPFKGE